MGVQCRGRIDTGVAGADRTDRGFKDFVVASDVNSHLRSVPAKQVISLGHVS